MKHHKQVYPYYSGSRSVLGLMNINVKLLLQPFTANLIFIYISKTEKFSLWQNQNSHLLFFFFLPLFFFPPGIEYFILEMSDCFGGVTCLKALKYYSYCSMLASI